MVCSSEQRQGVDRRVEYLSVSNAGSNMPNIQRIIQIAFVFGIRMAMAHPSAAGDYMGRWIADNCGSYPPEEVGKLHEKAIHAIVFPLDWTPEEWHELEGAIDEEDKWPPKG